MTIAEPPVRRRVTLVELLIVIVIAAVLAAIAVPVFLDDSEDPALLADLRLVQDAVRRYHTETGAHPTYAPPQDPSQPQANPWLAGDLPSADWDPAHAGIDFAAEAVRNRDGVRVRFLPDYLAERPRHAGETASDGTRRWRVDRLGNVSIELDGRSY